MGKINITGNVSGNNIQIGQHNAIYTTGSISTYEKELLSIFEKYCTTDSEKEELLNNLRQIEISDPIESSSSAAKIMAFLKTIGTNLVSSGFYDFLKHAIIHK
jgi:hypothetical protein